MKEKMRNTIRRVLSVFVALVMVLGVMGANVTPVMADETGSITIRNTTKNATYHIYKVFDATYNGSSPDQVSYYYNGSNQTFIDALNNDESPFAFNSNTRVITLKEGKTIEDITSFLEKQVANLGNSTDVTGTGDSVTTNGFGYGYYYITTTTGSVVTINTTRPNVTVVDKNETIPIPVKTESIGTYSDVDNVTANIGDKIDYKVTGKIKRYQGEVLVKNLVFVDTLSEGLTRDTNTNVTIKVTKPSDGTERTLNANEYTVNNNGQVMTITLPTASASNDGEPSFNFEENAQYTITYSAYLNEKAKIGNDEPVNKNTVDLKYNDNIDIGQDTTTVHTYEIGVTKTDGTKQLSGAKFRLYDAKTGGNEIPVVAETTKSDGTAVYRHAKKVLNETGVEMEVGSNGMLAIQGLKNGTYYLEETEAPEGYNKLAERTEAIIIDNNNNTVTVTNTAGTLLPSTGGIGTTIFYVIGGVIVAGAIVLLIARRRKRNA